MTKNRKTDRGVLEGQIEALVKQIVFWRDGSTCVLEKMDGGRCRPGAQWGHVIPRQLSSWLKYDLSNGFVQCPTHNYMHHQRDGIYLVWYANQFGADALAALHRAQREHVGKKHTIGELREMSDRYTELLENLPVIFDRERLILLGYYGDIIKEHYGKNIKRFD